MDPELEQMLLAMQTYYMNGDATPYLYPTGPAPDPTAPELDPFGQYVYATGAAPNTNKSGELLPYNLDYQKSLTNYQQDINQMIADPVNAYMSSLLGGEGFAPGVFDPVIKETPIQLQGLPILQTLASSGGYQGALAKAMLPKEMGGGGMNPGSAVAVLQRLMNNPDAATELGFDPQEVAMIKAELPVMYDNITGRPMTDQFDWKSVASEASSMFQPMAKDQAAITAPGVTARDGQYFSTEQIDSPQTEFLKKLGIPDPNARYDLQYALQNDPSIAGLFQHVGESQTQVENMRKTFDEYTKKITKQREVAAKAKAEDERKMKEYQQGALAKWANNMEVYGNTLKGQMGDYFRDAAAGGPQFQAHEGFDWGATPDLFTGAASPIGNVSWGGGMGEPEDFREMKGGKVSMADYLPDFAWPGEKPEAPKLSPFAGRSADEVAQLFNASLNILPKSMQGIAGTRNTPRMAVEAQRKPLQQALQANNKIAKEQGMAYMSALVPYLRLNRLGRTPAKDVIQQRLLPAYASGAFGQQGLPTSYPNRSAVEAMMGG